MQYKKYINKIKMEQENNIVETRKRKPRIWNIILIIVLLGVIGLLTYFNVTADKRHKEQIEKVQLQYQMEIAKLTKANRTIDSLFTVANHLTKYRALVEAGYTRDSSRIMIPHAIGDIVKLKVDSSNVVIVDIIVGGGMFEYYVKYKVMNSKREVEEISPELIF